MGDHLRAELDLFIELEVVPRRKAYLEVFRGELQAIDERLNEPDVPENFGRLELAGLDYQIMLENWTKHEEEQMNSAERSLQEQFDIADAAGVINEYRASIQEALNNQKLLLMSDGLEVLVELVPEARADQDSPPNE